MKEEIGKVIEVFIPEEHQNGSLLDVMDRKLIGFKIMTSSGLKEIIEKADEFNSEIMKNDLVIITGNNISLYEGDEND